MLGRFNPMCFLVSHDHGSVKWKEGTREGRKEGKKEGRAKGRMEGRNGPDV